MVVVMMVVMMAVIGVDDGDGYDSGDDNLDSPSMSQNVTTMSTSSSMSIVPGARLILVIIMMTTMNMVMTIDYDIMI